MKSDETDVPSPDPVREAPPRRPARRWRWIVIVAAVALAVTMVVSRAQQPREGQPGGKGRKGAPPAQRAIPVVGAPARTGDMGIYQTGLGTATPLRTVTVS
jgi:hypothetical protein